MAHATIHRPAKGGPHKAPHHIKAWRVHKKLSQDKMVERMAELLNEPYDRTVLSKVERGLVAVTERTLLAAASALAVEPGALFVRPDIYLLRQRRLDAIDGVSDDELAQALALIRVVRR
jgi:transcriptional regulator with XRE-family HTH domain